MAVLFYQYHWCRNKWILFFWPSASTMYLLGLIGLRRRRSSNGSRISVDKLTLSEGYWASNRNRQLVAHYDGNTRSWVKWFKLFEGFNGWQGNGWSALVILQFSHTFAKGALLYLGHPKLAIQVIVYFVSETHLTYICTVDLFGIVFKDNLS